MQSSALSVPHTQSIIRSSSRRGCLTKLFFVAFGLVMIPTFFCGVSLVIYLLFPPPHVDILVMGLDSRTGQGSVARSDSIMLVGVDPALLRVSLLSIPRDLYLEAPNYGPQPVNTINMLGELEASGSGPNLLSRSIELNFGVTPERYLRMDFDAFVELVDAVGGVTVYVDRVIEDNAYPTDNPGEVISVRFESGWQYMDGARALIYARTRHADDDYRRAERQQQVLSAVARRLLNPLNWARVLGVFVQHTDSDLTIWDAVTLAPPVLLNAGRFEQLVINRDYVLGTAQGYAVPDYGRLSPWLEERFD
jgi:LCP family protein required for cell wall assembly